MRMDDVAFMDHTAFVTPSLVERILTKHHVEALVDAHELAYTIIDTAKNGIYHAYYFLKERGVDALTAAPSLRIYIGSTWVIGWIGNGSLKCCGSICQQRVPTIAGR